MTLKITSQIVSGRKENARKIRHMKVYLNICAQTTFTIKKKSDDEERNFAFIFPEEENKVI